MAQAQTHTVTGSATDVDCEMRPGSNPKPCAVRFSSPWGQQQQQRGGAPRDSSRGDWDSPSWDCTAEGSTMQQPFKPL